MGKRPLNLPFLGLQALLILIDCIAVAYVSPILVSFGYSPMRIGRVMTLAALAATLARPVWGYLNDHFACARQVTLLATAAGISCYCLLVFGGDARPAVTAVAVMGLNVTIVCMMNFVDAWALRLISEGYVLNYGATRAGGSLSFALGAMVFGWAAARWGFRPGSVILWVLFILLAIVILHLPNPAPASASSVGFFTALHHDAAALAGNRAYRLMLLASFLCMLASCAIDSFHSVLILALGGTERHVGAALFVQAICELPVMIGYTRLRDRLCAGPAVLMSAAMVLRFTCADAGLRSQSVGAFGRIVAASAFFRAVYTCLRGFHIKNGIPAAPFHRPPGLSGSWIRSCRHGGEYAQRCRSECRRHLPHVFSDELTDRIRKSRISCASCSHSERKKGIRMIFIGCDGGSTKTEWLLCNERGRVLAHRTFSGCNCAFLGEDGFARLMADSAESLLADAGINAADVASAMFALTGYGEIPGTESSFPAALRAALPGCGQILIDNDSVAGWAGSLAAKPGINVVAGTGSVAYGRDPQRHGYRVGGWSLFFADEGSCSWVARQLITEFVKQSDGRRPRSAIYEEVRSALGITKDLYVSGYLQTEVRNNSALLAQLQPVALRAARRGDTSALDIYRRAAAELAETAVAIRCKLDFPVEVPVRVSYSGGLFHAGEIILQPFRKEMEQNGFTIEPPLYSPVIGATALAAERFISPAALDDLLANAAQAL